MKRVHAVHQCCSLLWVDCCARSLRWQWGQEPRRWMPSFEMIFPTCCSREKKSGSFSFPGIHAWKKETHSPKEVSDSPLRERSVYVCIKQAFFNTWWKTQVEKALVFKKNWGMGETKEGWVAKRFGIEVAEFRPQSVLTTTRKTFTTYGVTWQRCGFAATL